MVDRENLTKKKLSFELKNKYKYHTMIATKTKLEKISVRRGRDNLPSD